jgi:hypothetical protein
VYHLNFYEPSSKTHIPTFPRDLECHHRTVVTTKTGGISCSVSCKHLLVMQEQHYLGMESILRHNDGYCGNRCMIYGKDNNAELYCLSENYQVKVVRLRVYSGCFYTAFAKTFGTCSLRAVGNRQISWMHAANALSTVSAGKSRTFRNPPYSRSGLAQ